MSAFLRHSSRLRTVTSSFPISSFTIICVGVRAGRLKVEGAVFGLGVMPVTFEILLVITEISTHVCLLRPQGPYICNKTCLFFFFFFFSCIQFQAEYCDKILIVPQMLPSVLPFPSALVIFNDNHKYLNSILDIFS